MKLLRYLVPPILAAAMVASAAVQAAEGAPRLLILADAADDLPTLAARLEAEGYEVDRSDQTGVKPPLVRCQSVIVYVHKPLLTPVERALIDYAQGGGRLLVLHHGIASAKWGNPKWLDFLGVAMAPREAAEYPWCVSNDVTFTMVNLAPGHFITTHNIEYDKTVDYRSPDRAELRGEFPAFDLPHTELYHHHRFTDGREKTILFGYRLDAPLPADAPPGVATMEDTAGWLKRTGKGWTFYFQPGHAQSDFEKPAFMQVILNCLVWPGKP